MSKIRAIVLALLVSMFAFFAGCDDDDAVEEEPQAGQEVECVVTEEESCEDEPADTDMEVPEEELPVDEELDAEVPVEEEPVEDPSEEEEPTEEEPVEESEEEEEPESEDPEVPAGEEMPG